MNVRVHSLMNLLKKFLLILRELQIWTYYWLIKDTALCILTDAMPMMTRRHITMYGSIRAHTGINMFATIDMIIPKPTTCFPPNLSASQPPITCKINRLLKYYSKRESLCQDPDY